MSGADLRLPALALVAWAAALAAELLPHGVLAIGGLAALGALLHTALRRRTTPIAWLLVALAVGGGAVLRAQAVQQSPVTALARDGASVSAVLVVTSDPRTVGGRFGSRTMVRARVREVVGRGRAYQLRAPVLVFGPTAGSDGAAAWARLRYGERVAVDGRLETADDRDLAAILGARGPPRVLAEPGPLLRAAARARAGVRAAAAGLPAGPRALVPALVDGDDTTLAADVQDDFRTTGLTHLLAVSGTNLTLVVGFLLGLARVAGVRARWLTVVGCAGVAGFVLLTRAEPSVLRAAAMGTVALLGLGSGGAAHGVRAWGACVVGLMLLDPTLAASAGFALSALATAGILFLAPGWRDALARWLPRVVAEGVAVPLAAQVVCTPLIAALSGQISLVAVVTNLLVAPAVGPATVLGFAGGVVATAVPALGRLITLPGGWCAGWIIAVAQHAARLPMPAGDVPTGPIALTVLTACCLVVMLVLGAALARRRTAVGLGALLLVVVLVPLPTFGWPPQGWVLVACDVGQGDGLVLRAGAGAGVVVDTGPDPAAMDRCLRGLGIDRIPLVVLTHFHADHVGGLAGVLHGRQVGRIEVSPYALPVAGAESVRRLAAAAHVPVVVAQYGEARTLGPLHWQVLAPSEPAPADSDSPPNDDSIVLYVETRGARLLMMGDEETGSQEHLHALFPDLHADVLKVAHHGSAKQDPDLVRSIGAKIGVISVGLDNDYGHPAPSTLALLHDAGIRAYRTDRDGAVAVVVDHGLHVATHG